MSQIDSRASGDVGEEVERYFEDHSEITDGIFKANLEDLREHELESLAENLAASGYEPAKIVASGIREKIKDVLPEFENNTLYNLRSRIYPSRTKRESTQRDLRWMKEILDKENLYVLRVHGKAVGVIGAANTGKMPDGREVYEIVKASVLKEYQGKGYYKQLGDFIESDLKKMHPDSPLTRCTKSPIVKKRAESLGWHKWSREDNAAVAQFLSKEGSAFQRIGGGYEMYYFDPLEKSGARHVH